MHRHEFTSPEEGRHCRYVCAYRVRATLFFHGLEEFTMPMSSNAVDRNRSGRRYTYGVSLTNRRLPFNDIDAASLVEKNAFRRLAGPVFK